jgi:hypothetical protein
LEHNAAEGLDTVYHEATHAYFDLRQDANDRAFLALLASARRYYADAPFAVLGQNRRVGSATTDEQIRRAVSEAAGEYVGNQVFRFWSARSLLEILRSPLLPNGDRRPSQQAIEQVRRIRTDYEDRWSSSGGTGQQFGYTMTDETFSPSPRRLLKPIMPRLAYFLDNHLLEGRMAARFEQLTLFQPILQELAQTYGWSQGEILSPRSTR